MSLLVGGCFSAKTVPLATPTEDSRARVDPTPEGRGSVIIIRPDAYAARASWFAVAVNDRVIGWTANGTYYRLNLLPGAYQLATFPSLNLKTNGGWATETVNISVQANRRHYFLHKTNFMGGGLTFAEIDEQEALAHLQKSKLARFDARNLPLSNFSGLFDTKGSPQAGSTPATSSSGFSEFLEGLAVVLLIGLVVVGASYAQTPTPAPSLAQHLINQPAIYAASNTQYKTSRGADYHLNGTSVVSGSGSEQWRIRDRTLTSSSGTSYQISSSGKTVWGDRGQTYQISESGKQITGSDGSVCRVSESGNVIRCD
jgi:hypothetical protein